MLVATLSLPASPAGLGRRSGALHLKPQGNLVIIPDGILGALPFGALVNPDSQHYLLEDYTLKRKGISRLNQDKRDWDTSLDDETANPEVSYVACPDVGCYDLDLMGEEHLCQCQSLRAESNS